MTRKIRLAFVGGCQVAGMSLTARRLRPDLDIEAYHIGAPLSGPDIVERITDSDVIVTQFEPGHAASALTIDAIQSLTARAVLAPVFRFTGLHPDLAYIPHDSGVLKGVGSDYHSLIVAAAFSLGLSRGQAERLFNPLVFAGLGYFDVFAAAQAVMETRALQAGLDLTGCFDAWRDKAQPFMHTFNHPAICVLKDYTVMTMVKAGLVDPGTPAPDAIEDTLASSFVAPVLPPLAKRLNCEGGTTFLLTKQGDTSREMSLSAFIDRSYALYADMNPDHLELGRIPEIRESLKQILA